MSRVVLVNESTVLSDADAWNIAWALDYYAKFHIARAWPLIKAPGVVFMPKSHPVPPGAMVLHMLDTSDQEGAIGYHDEDGNEVPFARVFCKTAQENGTTASEVAAHELGEMLADPHINQVVIDQDKSRLIAQEVGDPVQGNPYDLGAPERRQTGVMVADFALPSWFDPNTPDNAPTSFRSSVKGPFTLAPQGYISYLDLKNPQAGWQQQLGGERTSAPVDLDDRLTRR